MRHARCSFHFGLHIILVHLIVVSLTGRYKVIDRIEIASWCDNNE